jgi:hypothetical protein
MHSNLYILVDMTVLITLSVCAFFCLNHSHSRWHSPKSVGLAAICGAALGRGLAFVWPGDNAWLLPWLTVTLHLGFVVFIGAMAMGKLHELLKDDRRENSPDTRIGGSIERRFHRVL